MWLLPLGRSSIYDSHAPQYGRYIYTHTPASFIIVPIKTPRIAEQQQSSSSSISLFSTAVSAACTRHLLLMDLRMVRQQCVRGLLGGDEISSTRFERPEKQATPQSNNILGKSCVVLSNMNLQRIAIFSWTPARPSLGPRGCVGLQACVSVARHPHRGCVRLQARVLLWGCVWCCSPFLLKREHAWDRVLRWWKPKQVNQISWPKHDLTSLQLPGSAVRHRLLPASPRVKDADVDRLMQMEMPL